MQSFALGIFSVQQMEKGLVMASNYIRPIFLAGLTYICCVNKRKQLRHIINYKLVEKPLDRRPSPENMRF